MKKERLNYILVGIFTLSMIVLLIGVLYRLTGQNNEIDYYKSTYANITGIKISSEVSYGGYRIGFVEAISPIRKSGSEERLENSDRKYGQHYFSGNVIRQAN